MTLRSSPDPYAVSVKTPAKQLQARPHCHASTLDEHTTPAPPRPAPPCFPKLPALTRLSHPLHERPATDGEVGQRPHTLFAHRLGKWQRGEGQVGKRPHTHSFCTVRECVGGEGAGWTVPTSHLEQGGGGG